MKRSVCIYKLTYCHVHLLPWCWVLLSQTSNKKRSPVTSNDYRHNHPYQMYNGARTVYKRQVVDEFDGRTCSLFLQTDPELWKYMTGDGSRQLGYVSFSLF